MKKLTFYMLLALFTILFTGCMNKSPELISTEESKDSKVNQASNVTEEKKIFPKTEERPIAVMIDNEGIAISRHSGLDQAYAVYELIVEGSDSRLMALFKGTNTAVIGPVRSSRHYFIHYALEHDAIYVHFGWSPLAQKAISTLRVNNINGIKGVDGSIFWRNPKKRNDWHNAFTSIEKIKNMAKKKKYRDMSLASPFTYNLRENDLKAGVNASKVNIQYSAIKKINYEYDAEKKLYKRFIKNTPHVDAVSKVQYTAKNIIIQRVKNYPLNDGPDRNGVQKGRQQMDTVGKGTGYFITDGKYVEIDWEKSGIRDRTVYKNKDGTEVLLNNGQTWIQIIPINSKVTIE